MNLNEPRVTSPAFGQYVRLSADHRAMLETLKDRYRISHSDAIRRGIELVTNQFAPSLKLAGASTEA